MGAGPRLTRRRAAAAAVVARASGAASPATSRVIGSAGSAYSLLSLLSSSSAGGGARAAGARSAAPETAAPAVAAAAAGEDVVAMGDGLPANGDRMEVVAEEGEGVRAEAVRGRGNAAAAVAAVVAAPAVIATMAAVRPAARGKEKKSKVRYAASTEGRTFHFDSVFLCEEIDVEATPQAMAFISFVRVSYRQTRHPTVGYKSHGRKITSQLITAFDRI